MTIQFDENVIKLHEILTTITNLGYCPIPSSMSTTMISLKKKKGVLCPFCGCRLFLNAAYALFYSPLRWIFSGD